MDRVNAYPGEAILETDVLNGNKNTMIGLAKLAIAVLGPGPILHGLACTPGTGLSVQVAAGQIYQATQVDATAYSSLGTDSHIILKQGLLLDPMALSTPAPTGAGTSINYLIQVAYQDVDTGSVVLPFYNASNPAIPYSGPAGAGTPSTTVRAGKCVVQAKAGTATTTGTQVTPPADSGFVAAYVVQVDYGASAINAARIATVAGAPILTLSLPAAAPLNSPAFTGIPTVPTPAAGDVSLKAINSAFLAAASTIASVSQNSDNYFYGQL